MKYKLTKTQKQVGDITVYQIRALKEFGLFGCVKRPNLRLGGWVESEKNLSHEGTCWVREDGIVSGNATVTGDAVVGGAAHVFGNAKISEDAGISGDAKIFENAQICGNSHIYGFAQIHGDAIISGKSIYKGDWVTPDGSTK